MRFSESQLLVRPLVRELQPYVYGAKRLIMLKKHYKSEFANFGYDPVPDFPKTAFDSDALMP